MSQRKAIQINHALSGIHGPELKSAAQKVTDSRKQILRRLQRKKKLASVIQDELYWYLERFPEQVLQLQDQKQGLHQESTKKKKNKTPHELEDAVRLVYRSPAVEVVTEQYLLKDQNSKQKLQHKFSQLFSSRIDLEMEEEKTQ